MEYLSYGLAILVGVALGLIGGGGSILTVPILVYVAAIDAELATAYSLFVVGAVALVGSIQFARRGQVDFKTGAVFAVPSLLAVYATRAMIVPAIPDPIFTVGNWALTKDAGILLLFALVMFLAAISMIRSGRRPEAKGPIRYNYPLILVEGAFVGLLTGLVGAGGGFLIVPALVLMARLPMKLAVGTSLMIIAVKSLIGFGGDIVAGQQIDWMYMLLFTGFALGGIFLGTYLTRYIPGKKLKSIFGWFVLVMSVGILVAETGILN